MSFKFLSHTADIKIRAEAKTLEQVFKESSYALKETILEKIKIKSLIKKKIQIYGKDKESLLYNFLEEFLYLLDAEKFLVSKINKLKIKEQKTIFSLEAELIGDKAGKYKFVNHVKAITYNQMKIKKEKAKFIIEFVLDV